MIHVVHLYGNNGYDYGYAAGQLLKEEIIETLSGAWAHFEEQIVSTINGSANIYHLPEYMLEILANSSLEFLLDWQNEESAPFMDPQIHAEMHGMADATGLSYELIRTN